MAETNEGTTEAPNEAPATGTAPAAPATGTPPAVDEVTTLRSRNAGLDAKVTELSKSEKAAIARAEAAEARALELAQGKDNGDAELRTQLAQKEAEAAAARQEAALARIEAKYPETYGVLGAAAASLTADQLAASEARFAGVPAPATETHTPPTPGSINAPRLPRGDKDIESMSAAELRAHMQSTFTTRDAHGNLV